MQLSNRFFSQSLLSAAVVSALVSPSAVRAVDRVITAPVEINVDDPQRITVRQDITSPDSGQPVILINASSGGILIDVGRVIDTSPGPYENDDNIPQQGTIYLGENGDLEGVLDNQGHIRDGVFIAGTSSHASSSAYWSQGQDAENWASLEGGYNVLEGRQAESRIFDAINIDSYSYVDYITVGVGGEVSTQGSATSAIFVAENARVGGDFTQVVDSGTISITRTEGDAAFAINGQITASTGRAINIQGDVVGTLHLGLEGSIQGGEGSLEDTAAIAVDGSWTGTIQNQGDINTGIRISGTHLSNSGPAYWSVGTQADRANLSEGFVVVNDGVAGSTTGHGIHLDDYSSADFIGSIGSESDGGGQSTIASQAADRSAIYVDELARVGQAENLAAIAAANGGRITSANGDAITVDGDIIGYVHVNNGQLIAGSPSDRAVNFLSANSTLRFVQEGEFAFTSGSILASPEFKDDTVNLDDGVYVGETIQNVDHLLISTKTESVSITGDLVLPTQTTIVLDTETLTNTQGQEYTGIDTATTVITVGGELGVEQTGSTLLLTPGSVEAFSMIEDGVTIVVAEAGDISRDASTQLQVQSGSLLLTAEADYSSDRLTVTLSPFDIQTLADDLSDQGLSPQETTAIGEALDAAVDVIPDDLVKAQKIFDTLKALGNDVDELAEDIQPDVTASVQRAGQVMTNAAHRVVFNRVFGLRRGINYGDQFTQGATWGQLIYNNGKQSDVDDEPGFNSRTLGLTIGTDAEFEENSRIGLALTVGQSTVNADDGAKNSNYSFMGTLYTSWNRNNWFFDSMLSIGRGDNDTRKSVNGEEVKGTFQTEQWGFRVIGGTTRRFGNWDVSPQGEFNYGLVRNGTYEEKGNSGFEQEVSTGDYKTLELGAGLKFNGEYWMSSSVLKPELTFMGYYDFISEGSKVKAAYLAGGNAFTVTGPERDQFRLRSSLGLGIRVNPRWSFRAGYDYSWSKNYHSSSLSARTRYEF